MENKYRIIELIQKLKFLENKLDSLTYGSLDIRNNKYIYVHYRKDGKIKTEYAGEYSEELYNTIIKNNEEVKDIKKEMKEIKKELLSKKYKIEAIDENIHNTVTLLNERIEEIIYYQAKIDNNDITREDISNILSGNFVNNIHPKNITKILNIRNAWEFILYDVIITSKSNFELLCELNRIILSGINLNAGKIRITTKRIEGTAWIPDIPNAKDISKNINEIIDRQISNVSKAIELFLYIAKKQIFLDGNINTALMFVNHYLIANGCGIISIPDDLTEKFSTMLINYFNGKDTRIIKKFIIARCYIKFENEEKYIV